MKTKKAVAKHAEEWGDNLKQSKSKGFNTEVKIVKDLGANIKLNRNQNFSYFHLIIHWNRTSCKSSKIDSVWIVVIFKSWYTLYCTIHTHSHTLPLQR